jgi:NAD(P)-dependent dehydrogenase (short-subunit alcohol dehydrogenase family)
MTSPQDIEVVFFNAARIKPSNNVLDVHVGEIEEDFKTSNLALYIIAQHYVPKLLAIAGTPERRPALLVTNSHLPWDPVPQLVSLSLVKAAQRNMVQSLNRAYGDSGVQIGLVTVQGQVAPENKFLNPTNIAAKTVEFWDKSDKNELEVKIEE